MEARQTSQALILSCLAVIVAGGILLFWTGGAASQAADNEPNSRAASAQRPDVLPASPGDKRPALAQRAFDPANEVAAEFAASGADKARLRQEASEASDLMAELQSGNTQLSDFLVALDASEQAAQLRRDCVEAHLREPCSYSIATVIEPVGGGVGRVVYATTEVPADAAAGCREYTKCMAQGRVGRELPFPSEIKGRLSHLQQQTDNGFDRTKLRVEEVEQMIAILRESVEMMRLEGPDGTPDWAWRLALEESHLAEFELILKELLEAR